MSPTTTAKTDDQTLAAACTVFCTTSARTVGKTIVVAHTMDKGAAVRTEDKEATVLPAITNERNAGGMTTAGTC